MVVKEKKVPAKRKPRKKKVTANPSEEEIDKEIARIQGLLVAEYRGQDEYEKSHLWEFFEPFGWQSTVPDRVRNNLGVLAPAPNGIGKTVMMVLLIVSWMEGYEAWNEVDQDYIGAVRRGDKFYKPSSIGKSPPVDIRLTGEDWDHHLGRVVVKALRTWFPMENYTTKKNTSGVEFFWTHNKNGSTMELMTHKQDVKVFESWRGDAWAADEPPPYGVYKAMARGLAERKGKMIFFTTPLSQAWMLDILVRGNRRDIDIVKNLLLYDNEVSYENDNRILDELGIGGKVTRYWREADGEKKEFFDLILNKNDKGAAADAFLVERAGNRPDFDKKLIDMVFLRKARDTDPEEKGARFFGEFKALQGLVIKNFEPEKHIINEPENGMPTDNIITPMIDLHLSKPQAVSFFATDRRNLNFYIDEIWEHYSPEEIADCIIRRKQDKGWRIYEAYIDPLSKGDNAYVNNRKEDIEDSFTIIYEKLIKHGIELKVANKNKDSGYRNIRAWLDGPNGIPLIYFLNTIQSCGSNVHNGVLYEIQRLCFDDNGKVEKEKDDFMENFYRFTLVNVQWTAEEPECELEECYSGGQGWMGS